MGDGLNTMYSSTDHVRANSVDPNMMYAIGEYG